jgi:peptide chain release factor 2
MDWSEMLFQMYAKWGENKGFEVEVLDENPGEIGFRSASLKINGDYAYGLLKHETGVHRMVRMSKHDALVKII